VAAGTGAAAVVGRAAALGGGVKAWKEARLEGVIIIPPLVKEAAVLVLDWCRGEQADTMAGGTVGGGEPVPTLPPAADADADADADDEPDDKDDERASLLLFVVVVVSRTRRVGEGEEPDSSDKIPAFVKMGLKW
jgi:hypothetical protein